MEGLQARARQIAQAAEEDMKALLQPEIARLGSLPLAYFADTRHPAGRMAFIRVEGRALLLKEEQHSLLNSRVSYVFLCDGEVYETGDEMADNQGEIVRLPIWPLQETCPHGWVRFGEVIAAKLQELLESHE